MRKAHIVTWRSIVIEEWLVEDAANADQAKEMFLDGDCRLYRRSEHDGGNVRSVRVATQDEIDAAEPVIVRTPAPSQGEDANG